MNAINPKISPAQTQSESNDAVLKNPSKVVPTPNNVENSMLTDVKKATTEAVIEVGAEAASDSKSQEVKQIAEAVIENTVQSTQAKTIEREKLKQDIDGKRAEERSVSQKIAATKTVDDLKKDLKKKTRVVSLKDVSRRRVRTKTGQVVVVKLGVGEKSRSFKAKDDSVVLALNSNLSQKEIVEETGRFLTYAIKKSADKNSLDTGGSMYNRLARRFSRFTLVYLYNALIRPTILYNRIAATNTDIPQPLLEKIRVKGQVKIIATDSKRVAGETP
ncbi:hypothetical protein F9L33_09470 [Amylibacter sp. SFDW26]|uniref:hypothetical protein n=1 Tax=Amylibacter sp. SFDW26 TaxID=2652722 RepID=UPI0012617BF7|nr:hypothetical protein [Amylibacter sp. SFDW26]KAB7613599.1 hypothetical protein F9L33_09470 [Amylibacter sp. SFDW26]